MTSVSEGAAQIRLDNGKLRTFPVSDLKQDGVGPTDSEKALDDVAASLEPVPTSVPEVTKVLAPTKAVEVELKSVPVAPSKFRVPMEFKETPVSQVPAYASDERYFFQQKVDGIRGQLVLRPGEKPWFRSKSGDQLQSTTAAKISGPLLSKLGAGLPAGSPEVTIDGEMLDGKWYIFDMTVEGQSLPWDKRMSMAEDWAASMQGQGLPQVVALPTARTKEEKEALFAAVRDNGGEGVMIKRRDAKYKWGQRTEEILKAKITTTADVVVIERNRGGKDNAIIGVHKGGKLVEVGAVSTIGKENKATPIKVGDVLEVEYLWAHPGSGKLTQPRIKKPRPDKNPLMATDSQFRYVNKSVLDLPNTGAEADSDDLSSDVGTDIKPKSFEADVDPMPYAVSGVQDVMMLEEGAVNGKLSGALWQQKTRVGTISKAMESNPAFRARVKQYADDLRSMADGPTFVAVPLERIESVLNDGRLKTMFEKVGSTGGSNGEGGNSPGYMTARRDYENKVVGIGGGKPVKPSARPVYGYVGPTAGSSGMTAKGEPSTTVSMYGDIHLELKPNVAGRTTVTFDDSLNGVLIPRAKNDLANVPDSQILQSAVSGDLYWEAQGDPYKLGEGENSTSPRVGYVEAQIHGGVQMSDVARIHIDTRKGDLAQARSKLAEFEAQYAGIDPADAKERKRVESVIRNRKDLIEVYIKQAAELQAMANALRAEGYDVAVF